jgi:hypothetical protein
MTLLACAAGLGLAAASSAMAAFTPQIAVSQRPMTTSAATATEGRGTTVIRITVPRTDDALFRADIYVPSGYQAPLAQNVGTDIGDVTAQVEVREPVAGAVLPVAGNILVENPANHTASPCAPGVHAAVWMLVLAAAGQELRVPMYVDPTSGAEANLGAYRLRVCLPSPHIPASSGGATFGAKLILAQLNLVNVFRTPSVSGEYLFRLIATPWAAPATPNAAGTVEARATIGLPARLTIATSVRGRTLRVTGSLLEGPAGVSRATVVVRVGNRSYRVRTTPAGRYTLTVRFRRATRTTVRATAAVGVRTTPCASPVVAPGGCVSHTLAFFSAASVSRRVRIR